MKNFLSIVVLFSLILLVACQPKPITKIAGVVASFDPDGKVSLIMTSGPQITFVDGRFFVLKNMPNSPVVVGSEIEIYYTGKNAAHIFNDSIIVIKKAPQEEVFIEPLEGFQALAPGEFELLAKLIVAKGQKVTSSDCQYVHHDQFGNRHALIAIRRTNNRADIKAPVSQISVWVNGKNSPEDKIFFSYTINNNGVTYSDDADPRAISETISRLLKIARQ